MARHHPHSSRIPFFSGTAHKGCRLYTCHSVTESSPPRANSGGGRIEIPQSPRSSAASASSRLLDDEFEGGFRLTRVLNDRGVEVSEE